jgi:hypothetical protein
MRRVSTVFDSESEARLFHELDGRWCPRLRLLPQLPLSKLIQLDQGNELTGSTRRLFYETNVDYTFCWPDGTPWLSVEFDGLGGGFTRAAQYVPRPRCEPQRERKLAQKVKWCGACDYPLLIVSFDETQPLDGEAVPLTMLDGIVGQLLSRERAAELIAERFAEQEGWLSDLSAYEREDVAADMVLDADVDAEYEEDLLSQAVAEQAERCWEFGVFIPSISTDPWLYDPPILPPQWPLTLASLVEHEQATLRAERVGSRVRVDTPRGPVETTVWVRNVGQDQGVSPGVVANKFARYWVGKKVQRLMSRPGSSAVAVTS